MSGEEGWGTDTGWEEEQPEGESGGTYPDRYLCYSGRDTFIKRTGTFIKGTGTFIKGTGTFII